MKVSKTLDDKLLKEIKRLKLSPVELSRMVEQFRSGQKQSGNTIKIDVPDSKVKFGVLSDTHFGHKAYQPKILDDAARRFGDESVDFVLHAGDVCEGMSGRDGHIYELSHIGASEQMRYALHELNKIKQPVYFITASQSHDGWFSSKGNAGFELGPELASKNRKLHFLGYDEADILLDSGLKIRLVHPGDGVAYALSYKLQRYVNSLSGGQKPNIIFEGHYHKAEYFFYRNIHCFDASTLEAQTVFMKKKGSPAMMGYWIVEADLNRRHGVVSLKPEFVPFYE